MSAELKVVMHSSVVEMEALKALCIMHVTKSVLFVDELQLPNKRAKSVSLNVYRSICRSPDITVLGDMRDFEYPSPQ